MSHQTTPNLTRQDYFSTSLSGAVNVGDTVINLNTTPAGSEGYLVIDPNNPSTREIIYYWNKTSGTVTCPDATGGSGRGLGGTTVQTHASNTLVIQAVTAEDLNAIANGDGPGMTNLRKEAHPNFVIGGAVTATSGFGFQMASATAYVNGKRYTLNSQVLTANTSNDAYIDITDLGNGTAQINQTNLANGATTPAVVTNSDGTPGIRLAKVVSSGSAVTTITSTGADPLGNIYSPRGAATTSLLTVPYKFLVYRSGALTTGAGPQKVSFETKLFDTGNNYDATTNFRFTAPIAGFYQHNILVSISNGANAVCNVTVYKNGSSYAVGQNVANNGNVNGNTPAFNGLLQLAAGDYLEAFFTTSFGAGATYNVGSAPLQTYWSGFLLSAS